MWFLINVSSNLLTTDVRASEVQLTELVRSNDYF